MTNMTKIMAVTDTPATTMPTISGMDKFPITIIQNKHTYQRFSILSDLIWGMGFRLFLSFSKPTYRPLNLKNCLE